MGGQNLLSYKSAQGAVTVDINLGTSSGASGNDLVSGFINIVGGDYSDSITGNSLGNIIEGD